MKQVLQPRSLKILIENLTRFVKHGECKLKKCIDMSHYIHVCENGMYVSDVALFGKKKRENIEKAMKNNLRNSLRIHVCKTEIIFYVNTR